MLIGVAGDPRAGKDSVATALAKHGYVRYALADPMKAQLVALDPYVRAAPVGWRVWRRSPAVRLSEALSRYGGYEGLKASPYAAEWRRLCERQGTEAGREMYGEDHWLWTLQGKWEADGYDLSSNIVIPDVRFDNEADWIRARGGRIVKVKRPGTAKTTHISSRELPAHYVDYLIENGGSLAELEKKSTEMLRFFGQEAA